MNAGAKCQSRVEPCFISIRERLKAWLDDFLLHAQTEREVISTLREFFRICREHRLKVSARKSTLFSHSIHWCGRIPSAKGVQFDPQNLSGIINGDIPITARELSQYVTVSNGYPLL